MPLVLFNPLIGPYQVLPCRAILDLGAMAMKGAPYSPKPQDYGDLTIRLFSVIIRTIIGGGDLTRLQRCSQSILQPQLTGPDKESVQTERRLC